MPVEVVDTPRYKLHKRITAGGRLVTWTNMASGEIGVIESHSMEQYNGLVVLRTYGNLVSLSKPSTSWSTGNFTVRLLKPTDALTIVMKG